MSASDWQSLEREHASRVHAEAVAEHLRACEDRGDVSAAALDAARADVLRELGACDCLGFDTAHEALATLVHLADVAERFECSPEMLASLERYVSLRLAARLAGVRP